MNEEYCNLIFTGQTVEGKDLDLIHDELSFLLNTDIWEVKKLFHVRGTIIKRRIDRPMAEKLQGELMKVGAVCDIEVVADETNQHHTHASPTAPSRNPYAAPQSDLRAGQFGPADAVNFGEPQKRPASSGITWILTAFSLYKARPFGWMLNAVLYILVNIIALIPLIGPIAQYILGPVYMGGIMLGARALDENNEFSPFCVFYGFKNNFGNLVLLGLLFLVSIFVCVILGLVTCLPFIGFNLKSLSHMFTNPQQMALFPLLIVLVMLFFMIPLMMAYILAPALIAINQRTVFQGIALSFKGCLKNLLPFLVNGIVFLFLFFCIGALFSGMMAFMFRGGGPPQSLNFIFPIILFVILIMATFFPVSLLNIYAAYKDIFYKKHA